MFLEEQVWRRGPQKAANRSLFENDQDRRLSAVSTVVVHPHDQMYLTLLS